MRPSVIAAIFIVGTVLGVVVNELGRWYARWEWRKQHRVKP